MVTSEYGKLIGIHYAFYHGTAYGCDFEVCINHKIIEKAVYFTEGREKVEQEISNKAIDDAQWDKVEQAVLNIQKLLNVKEKVTEEGTNRKSFFQNLADKVKKSFTKPEIVLDGGNRFNFSLTWDNGTEVKELHYHHVNDRRFTTLIDELKEIVDPIGREITYYSDPVINGIYIFIKEGNLKYSHQCTLKDSTEENGDRRFFNYYVENGQAASYSSTVGDEVWQEISAWINSEKLEETNSIRYRYDNKGCTLYYDDGAQISKDLSKAQYESMKNFFYELVCKVKLQPVK